nr:vomeronasal type-1 receptor 4-like [Ovis aries]
MGHRSLKEAGRDTAQGNTSIFELRELQRDQRYLNRSCRESRGRGWPGATVLVGRALHLPREYFLFPRALDVSGRESGEEETNKEVGNGALADVTLFFCSVSPALLGHKRRPLQTTVAHMAVANSWVLLSAGPPHTMAAFVSRKPLSSLGCKFVYYIQRVARSTALCSPCILSTYQAFTLTPRRAEWAMLRGKAPRVTGPSCCTCWMLSLLMNIWIPVSISGPQDKHNYTDAQGMWFCSPSASKAGFVYLWSTSDAVFLTLMVWSSGSTVLLLHRRRQRVQYVHTPAGHHRRPPETRAAHTILMLVVTFVTFYLLNSVLTFYIRAHDDFHLWLMQLSDALALCFPINSPFLLLLRDPRTLRFCS